MMTSNNALIPDPDKEDILASKPWDWPFLHLGLRMCRWGDQQVKYYLLGTPVIYWGGAFSLIAFVLVFGVYLLRMQRKYVDMEPRETAMSIADLLILTLISRGLGTLPLCWQDCFPWMAPALR
jgi:dolichyl-phosphate-mannose--protein O-mannosyl transferase